MLKRSVSGNLSRLSSRRNFVCFVAGTAALAACGLGPALSNVHSSTDDRTGIIHLQCDPTWVDNRTSVTAACDMTPIGSKKYKIPVVRVLFEAAPPRPEWQNVRPDAKAAIFTPYKKLKVKLNYLHLMNKEGLEVKLSPPDFEHMVRCEKARLVYKNVGITLHGNNLAEMKTITNQLQES